MVRLTQSDSGRRTRRTTTSVGAIPHLTVELLAGRSEAKKTRTAEEVIKAVMARAECNADAVSVSIDDVESNDWVEKAVKPDIIGNPGTLYNKPEYDLC